ncbi:MAG TPA: type II toxin-antitoxin system VapC family toxin [Vicinamibacteria bacterium]|nr:type II toxin-antitoxin system VapC family toxin [Vicinamibacteria bacterium]
MKGGTPRRHCLDSWAVLRFLEGGSSAARRVRQVLRRERPVMSWINFGEVYYTVHRQAGSHEADEALAGLRPFLILDPASPERILAAARIKARHSLAYADAFAIATAVAHGAVLLTGDPELTRGDVGCRVEDLGSL